MKPARIYVVLVSAVVTLATLSPPASASARWSSTDWHTWRQPVYKFGQYYFKDPNVCLEWSVGATMHVTARRQNADGPNRAEYWKNLRLYGVEFDAYTYRGECGEYQQNSTKANVAQIELTGRVFGENSTACSWNPSLSVSVPFSISYSVAPTCGKTRTGLVVTDNHQPKNTVNHVSVSKPGKAAEFTKSGNWYTTRDGNDKKFCLGYKVGFKISIDHKHSSADYAQAGGAKTCWNVYSAD